MSSCTTVLSRATCTAILLQLSNAASLRRTCATVFGPNHIPMDLPSPTPICAAKERQQQNVNSLKKKI